MDCKNIKHSIIRSAQHNGISQDRCQSMSGQVGTIWPRRRRDWQCASGLHLLLVSLVLAFGVTHYSSAAYANDPQETGQEQTEIPRAAVVVDEEIGIIRFIIDGAEVMRLDETGLHVRGRFSSGGPQAIYGPAGFDGHIADDGDED